MKWILLCLCVIALNHKGFAGDDFVFSENVEVINDKTNNKNGGGSATNSEFIKRDGFAPIVYPGKFETKKILAKQESFGYPSGELPEIVEKDGVSLDTRIDPNV